MTSVLSLLDEIPVGPSMVSLGDWFFEIEKSLTDDPQGWVSAVTEIGRLSDESAWSLLSWVETAATHVVRVRSQAELRAAVFAMAIVLHSDLDRRDCSIVGSLLRRASVLAGLDFRAAIIDGCGRAGAFGESAVSLLSAVQARTPATHVESGAGGSFVFARAEPGFDVDDLARWLNGESQ